RFTSQKYEAYRSSSAPFSANPDRKHTRWHLQTKRSRLENRPSLTKCRQPNLVEFVGFFFSFQNPLQAALRRCHEILFDSNRLAMAIPGTV
ncbi:MAG: hypothetical protein PHR86_11355, partial [Desulfobacterales bacterium]|nr:hypothetical protein [Desulfobacterales bacterium]